MSFEPGRGCPGTSPCGRCRHRGFSLFLWRALCRAVGLEFATNDPHGTSAFALPSMGRARCLLVAAETSDSLMNLVVLRLAVAVLSVALLVGQIPAQFTWVPWRDLGQPAVLAYDTQRQRVVLFSGADTWEWDGERWGMRMSIHAPTFRVGSGRSRTGQAGRADGHAVRVDVDLERGNARAGRAVDFQRAVVADVDAAGPDPA